MGKPNLQIVLALTGSCVAEPHACGQQPAVELLKPCTKGTCTQPAGENNEASLEQFEKDAYKNLEAKQAVFKRRAAGPKAAAKKAKATKEPANTKAAGSTPT